MWRSAEEDCGKARAEAQQLREEAARREAELAALKHKHERAEAQLQDANERLGQLHATFAELEELRNMCNSLRTLNDLKTQGGLNALRR